MQLSIKQQFQIKNKDLKTALIKWLFRELKYQWVIYKNPKNRNKFYKNGNQDKRIINNAYERINRIGYEITRRKKAEKLLTQKVIKCQNQEK